MHRLLCYGIATLSLVMAAPAHAQPVAVGDAAPVFSFTDLMGRSTDLSQPGDWVTVYSIASRDNNELLMDWHQKVTISIVQRYPDLKVRYVNIADVSMVPEIMEGIVTPVLRAIITRTDSIMEKQFSEAGVQRDPSCFDSYMLPDWKGSYMDAMGVDNSDIYRMWVACDGRVVGYFDQNSTNSENRYLGLFDKMAVGCP